MSEQARLPHSTRRPPAIALWEHEHRWGTLIGDSTRLVVARTDGGSLRIGYGKDSVEVRESLVHILAAFVAAAAEWTDDPDPSGPQQ